MQAPILLPKEKLMPSHQDIVEHETQIFFKLGSIEAQVKSLAGVMAQDFEKLNRKIDDTTRESQKSLAKLEVRVDSSAEDILELDQWRRSFTSKILGGLAVLTVAWAVFGEAISATIRQVF